MLPPMKLIYQGDQARNEFLQPFKHSFPFLTLRIFTSVFLGATASYGLGVVVILGTSQTEQILLLFPLFSEEVSEQRITGIEISASHAVHGIYDDAS